MGLPTKNSPGRKFTFAIKISDPSIITKNFIPKLEKLTPISINGSYDSEAQKIDLKTDIPQITYDGVTVDSLNFSVTSDAQQLKYNLNIADVSNPTLRFQNISLGGEVKNNTLSFQFNTAKDDSIKLLAIGGRFKSVGKGFELTLDPQLILNSENWTLDKSNLIHFEKDGLYASNAILSNGARSVSFNSKEKIPAAPLQITFKSFETTTISRLIENKRDLIKGTIDGEVTLENKNGTSVFKSDLVIRDFAFQAVPVGTIKLKAGNYEDPERYDVDMSIEGNGNDIAVKGFYRASKTKDIDLLLTVKHLNLASVEPFTFKQLSQMSGSMNGQLSLKGPATLPVINGDINFKEAGFKPKILDSYLMVHNSKISFDSKKIRFDNFIMNDSLEHIATLNGTIDIRDLKAMEMDLRLKTTEFLALNTTRYDNPLYYGKLILDSDIKIKGTTDAPTLDAKLKINKGSTLTYVKPESQVSKNESKGVVDFINPTKQDISIMARQNDSIDGISKMKGIDLHASINFDKSVQLKMIVDRSTGDSLYIEGGGLLDFELDRSGKTNLAGKYNIIDGGYFLSLENLVKRNFKIQKGSSVTWSGDPLDPYIDLTAIYTIKTSPLDLVQNELAGVTEFEKTNTETC